MTLFMRAGRGRDCERSAAQHIAKPNPWAAAIAIMLLVFDIIGRVALVASGLYPTNSLKQTFAVAAGKAVAAIFAIYIGTKWKSFV